MRPQTGLMWENQILFQKLAQKAAKELFHYLDKELSPDVFLVGTLHDDDANKQPVCVEPENCGYLPESFSSVKSLASRLKLLAEEQPIILEESIKRSILNALNAEDNLERYYFYCSWPVIVSGYWVTTIISFPRDAMKQYPRLRKSVPDANIFSSLIESTATVFLQECSKALKERNPGSSLKTFNRKPDGIVRSAGEQLMGAPALAVGQKEAAGALFHSCNTISALRYEGGETTGSIIFARREHENIRELVAFEQPAKLKNYRAVRKLLELSAGELSLLSDASEIYGLGSLDGKYDSRREDLFTAVFTKYYVWELIHSGSIIMQSRYGQPSLPKARIDEHAFKTIIRKVFGNVQYESLERLWEAAQIAIEQKKGTMLVVSLGAAMEADRLKNQCTKIKPQILTSAVLRKVTAIDGAVLTDPDGVCRAIGVILDGLASTRGDAARGARYNSAIRYVESSRFPCISIVVSEDGSIDLIHK